MQANRGDRKVRSVVRMLALVLLSACMTACAGKTAKNSVFWPGAPDLPRIQFLTAFKDSKDVIGEKKLSLLDVGGTPDIFINLVKPYGITSANGKLYICDTLQADVITVDLPNKKMTRLSGNVNAGRLKKPVNVAVDARGNIYVADTSRLEVLQYAPDGSYVRSIGTSKDLKPVDVRVDDLYLYILDGMTSQVHLYDIAGGDYVKSIGRNDDPKRNLAGPTNMALDSKGGVYVSNFGSGRIIKLDRDGNFHLGFGKLGSSFADFTRPRGITVDETGLVYVVDAGAQHVQIFDDRFRLLLLFAGPGTPGSLNIPAGITVSTDNLDYYQTLADPDFKLEKVIFVVSQVGEHKVSVYGLGKKEGIDYAAEEKKTMEDVKKRAAEAAERRRKLEEEKAAKELEGGETKAAAPAPEPAAQAADEPVNIPWAGKAAGATPPAR
uniref:NHL repeat containing protein n=1 Tax=Geobacter sp. (strain M21) TaxID=443144 RepID=C6E3E8_GEOSM